MKVHPVQILSALLLGLATLCPAQADPTPKNATAVVLRYDAAENSTLKMAVPLSLITGTNYYGIYPSSEMVSGQKYFVRLDTNSTAGIASTVFTVS